MDTGHKRKCVRACACGSFCALEWKLILSGHGITAGGAGSAFTVQIKTAEITTTIENRFSPRYLNDIVKHTHNKMQHMLTLMIY